MKYGIRNTFKDRHDDHFEKTKARWPFPSLAEPIEGLLPLDVPVSQIFHLTYIGKCPLPNEKDQHKFIESEISNVA